MGAERSADGLLRIVLLVLAVVVLFPLVMMLFSAPMMGMMGWGWNGGMTGGVSPLWGFGMLFVWLVVLLGIGYLLYRAFDGFGSSVAGDRALEELRVAYARGEVSDEEFEERRSKLSRDE